MGAFDTNRTVYAKVVIGSTTVTSQDIISMTIEESVVDQNIAIGSTNSQVLTVKLHKGSYVVIGATMTPSFSFDNTTWTQMGVFRATDCVNEYEDVYTITAYDSMAFLDGDYEPTVTTPTTIRAVLNDICTQKGLTLQSTAPTTAITTLYEGTYRETIGYMAGLMGKNAIINRNGNLDLIWFSASGETVSNDYIYESECKTSGSVTITALISGGETSIESGSGRSISFYNPYMTQTILDNLVSTILPFTYDGVEVKYRGNPAYELGDIITVDTYTTPIMRHIFEYDGGLYATIYSYGLSDNKSIVAMKTPTQKEVERDIKPLQQMVEGMNEDLLAGRNGYVVDDIVTDSSGTKYRRAIRAMDTPTVTSTTKGIEINSRGIGWSENGFTSFVKMVLDFANGKLYADQVIANSVLSNTFYIGLNDTNYSIKFDGSTGNIIIKGNIYRSGATTGTDDFLIGINDTPNLQIGSALQDSTSVYSDVNIYSNDEIRFMVNGAKTSSNAKVIINQNGTLELKYVPSETTTTNAILCIDSSGNVCDSGKTIADIGGGESAYVVSSSAPSDTTKIWIDISTGYYIPRVYYSSAWHALNATFG